MTGLLTHDPIPWLLEREGLPALRARRLLDIDLEADADAVHKIERDLAKSQSQDGSFEQSPMKTAGVLNLLDDLRAPNSASRFPVGQTARNLSLGPPLRLAPRPGRQHRQPVFRHEFVRRSTMHIQAVTISVKSLEGSRPFYEEILGFEPAFATEEPYLWQAYKSDEEAFFAIIETPDLQRQSNMDIVNFVIDDVEQLWEKVKDRVTVELEPHMTPYGAYKFIIKDPDGFRLGFVTEDYEEKKKGSSA